VQNVFAIPIWRAAILLLALAPLAYYVVAIFAAIRFFRRERAKVLPDFQPPLSVLKPVHGTDFASYENFASFCRQNYGDYEFVRLRGEFLFKHGAVAGNRVLRAGSLVCAAYEAAWTGLLIGRRQATRFPSRDYGLSGSTCVAVPILMVEPKRL
jgi:hypothetical protein